MKKRLTIALAFSFLLALGFNSLASDYEYDVSGHGDGGYYHGEIEANRGEKEVEGYLYDEDGNEVEFEGEWTGHGEIEGYDENGNYIELEVD